MNIGQRVKINLPDTVWHNKEGVVESINDSICTVFVDFIPEQGKKIRQDFSLDSLSDDLEEAFKNKETNEIGDIEKDFNNGYVLFKSNDGKQSQVAKDDLEEVEEQENTNVTNTTLVSSFEEDLIELDDAGREDELRWFFDDNGSYALLKSEGFDKTNKAGRIEQETRSSNDRFYNPNNITVYALKKGKGSGNQFRAYFYRNNSGECIFVRGHIKKGYDNGPKEYKCIQDTIDYANSKLSIDKNK